MRICVLTIVDNLGNRGSLVQATAMLKVFNAEAVVWKRDKVWQKFSENCDKETKEYYESLNIGESFNDYKLAANYINTNFDLMIVGSDELWKAGDPEDSFSIPYPNPFWGSEITIKKVALAVSTGSIDILSYPESVRKGMHEDLSSFDLIYVRDRKSVDDLTKIGVEADGILPDPSFAIDYPITDKLPTDNVTPLEWFSSFSNLLYIKHERMHKLLACIRSGTPCLSYDHREKSKEIKRDFMLPEGDLIEIVDKWPYESVVEKCKDNRQQWVNIVKRLKSIYGLEIDDLSNEILFPPHGVKPASSTYMFDSLRTGRTNYDKGLLETPEVLWKRKLPNDKPYSPESTAIFDRKGNIYFGCHDGLFYSLDGDGEIRWSFKTHGKIYSSPLMIPDKGYICFASGDGFLYSLNLEGKLLWKEQIGRPLSTEKALKRQKRYRKKYHPLHEINRIASANAWASPNMLSDGTICICGYEFGLTVLNPDTGKIKWRFDLGEPAAHLAGVAIMEDNIIAVSQQRRVFKISPEGQVIWSKKLRRGYNAWGNPSVNPENGDIYVPVSKREDSALIYAFNQEGKRIWKTKIPEGTRGTISISRENYLICCGFKGNMYFIDKKSGKVIKVIEVTDGKMWTSASIDSNGYIFVPVIDSSEKDTGRLCCFDKQGELIWEFEMGKGHSVPVIDSLQRLYLGSWTGEYICLQT